MVLYALMKTELKHAGANPIYVGVGSLCVFSVLSDYPDWVSENASAH